jgi:hypothetical protein
MQYLVDLGNRRHKRRQKQQEAYTNEHDDTMQRTRRNTPSYLRTLRIELNAVKTEEDNAEMLGR